MLQCEVSGVTLPPGVMLRESPTLQSLGKTTIRPLPGSTQYAIDSFFDVFTELSNDGVNSWIPSSSKVTVGLAPIPCISLICPAYTNVECGGDISPAALGSP